MYIEIRLIEKKARVKLNIKNELAYYIKNNSEMLKYLKQSTRYVYFETDETNFDKIEDEIRILEDERAKKITKCLISSFKKLVEV